ncbi:MAG: HPr(Ser) kinase/phosphatase [Kiritimatiellae bacterium]|nr:HPr(Ser) kinase/phosphatase [Kiritimatiellia bacterium]
MPATVKDFIDKAKEKIPLEVVTGEIGLTRIIHESPIHRPGLALAGFFAHFAFRRIQVLGMAEMEYLAAMPAQARRMSLQRFFERHIPCVVICRNRKIQPEFLDMARRFKIAILRTPMITGKFINAATLIMESQMAPTLTMQGTVVDIMGIGVMIEGKPGIGKSEAALVLVIRGHSLIADDLTMLRRLDPRTVTASSVPITRYHMDIRGLGIIHIPSLFGVASVQNEKNLDLIITLKRAEQFTGESLESSGQRRDILGVAIPNIVIPVAPGRDLASLIEVAALNAKLKKLGHDAAKELDDKIKAVLTQQADH